MGSQLVMTTIDNVPTTVKYVRRTITRTQAMEKFQPIIDEIKHGFHAMPDEVRRALTREMVKVLPACEKAVISRAATVLSDGELLMWVADAKDDIVEYTWRERVEVPRHPEDRARRLSQELKAVTDASSSSSSAPNVNARELLRTKIQAIRALVEAREERFQEHMSRLEQDVMVGNGQLRRELDGLQGLLEGFVEGRAKEDVLGKPAELRKRKRCSADYEY